LSLRFPISLRRVFGTLRVPTAGSVSDPVVITSHSVSARTPVAFVIITADYCSRTFGVAPCTATGVRCYNTFPTCKDAPNYGKISRSYRYVSPVAPLPLALVRPYVKSVKLLPTEIKTNLTVSGRVTVEMADEPDTDVGVDPYVTTRTAFPAIPGTYWKKWLTRNRNYKGRTIDIYEGFVGDAEGDYVKRWTGRLDNITRSGLTVKIEAVDLLKDIAKIDVPPKLNVKLSSALDSVSSVAYIFGTSSIDGEDADLLDDPSGTLLIGDEIVTYTGISAATGEITGLTRGTNGTTAAEHAAKAKVQKCKVYASQNPFDLLKSMLLTDAEIAAGNVDDTAFDYWRDYPGDDPNISAIITEPTKLNTLFFEIVDLLDCKVWVGEDLKITIARDLPSDPLRAPATLTDAQGIIHGSGKVDQNEKSRITRALFYWDKTPTGKVDEAVSYRRVDLAIDADAESANDYNEVVEKKILCRWLHSEGFVEEVIQQFAKNFACRVLWTHRDAQQIVTVDVDLKDDTIKTGGWVQLSTDEMVDIFGAAFDAEQFQVVKRENKETKIALSLLRGAQGRCLMVAPDSLTGIDWEDATPAQQTYGAISDNDGTIPTGGDAGYRIW
jgi:hypothetical protein